MFSAAKTSGPSAVSAGDPEFNYVTALLHGDGTNGAQNNTFLDSSSNAFTITRNGTPTQGSFSPYGTLWSNYFNGSTDYLVTNQQLSLGSGNFTTELWVYNNGLSSNQVIFDFRVSAGSYPVLYIDTTNKLNWIGPSSVVIGTSTSAISLNTWTHVVVVRNGTTSTFYINGVASGTFSDSNSYNGNYVSIGVSGLTGDARAGKYNGYMSNMRFVVGTAVYTSNFTPSTTPLTAITNTSLLTCQSNRFLDNSTNNYTFTVTGTPSIQRFSPFLPTSSQAYSTSVYGGSGYFNGSTDYLTIADATAFNLSGGSYTLEMWINPTGNYSNYNTILSKRILSSTNTAWEVYLNTGTGVLSFYNGTNYTSSVTPTANTWNHVAAVYDGTNINLYLNGVRVLQASTTNTNYSASVYIGNYPSGSEYFNGYIDDVRITKGAALYTSTFTPPTAPLTTTVSSGTVSLLCNMTNAGIYDNAMMPDWITVGSAQISTSVKKYGTGSLSFNGSGSSIYAISNPVFGFGTGNFTIEFWLYLNATTTQTIVSELYSGTTQVVPHIYYSNGSGIRYYVNGADAIVGGSLSTSTWYHIAVCRSSGSTKMFINGTQTGSTYTDSNNYLSSTPFILGDYDIPLTGTTTLNGYIDDLRITNGYARYTSSFTPPTSAFPNY